MWVYKAAAECKSEITRQFGEYDLHFLGDLFSFDITFLSIFHFGTNISEQISPVPFLPWLTEWQKITVKIEQF